VASDIFIDRLLLIDAVRFDDADKDIMPFKVAFEEMERYCGEKKNPPSFFKEKESGISCSSARKETTLFGLMAHSLTHFFALVLCDLRAAFFSQISHKNSSSFK